MASRKLSDLSDSARPKIEKFLALLVEAKIPVLIVETRRSQAEHEANVKAGKSWTQHSRHIDGDAIDICPFATYNINGPDTLQWSDHPAWEKIGLIGESCGLTWGGRWKQRDLGHFQI